MPRLLVLTFEITDDTPDGAVLDLADRLVATLDPDPPVLVYEGSRIEHGPMLPAVDTPLVTVEDKSL